VSAERDSFLPLFPSLVFGLACTRRRNLVVASPFFSRGRQLRGCPGPKNRLPSAPFLAPFLPVLCADVSSDKRVSLGSDFFGFLLSRADADRLHPLGSSEPTL